MPRKTATPKPPREKKPPKYIRDLLAHREEHGGQLVPCATSPICIKCGMNQYGASNPYLDYRGSENPVVTVVMDSVSSREDDAGKMGAYGPAKMIREVMQKAANALKLDFDVERDVRFVATTRCSSRTLSYAKINFKTKGNHCRAHLVEDLERFRPKLIMPVGTAALGLLSHKGNAQTWSGRVLTYRGWPDDWITHPLTQNGVHPAFGTQPDWRLPMTPIQAPRMVYAQQNGEAVRRWHRHIARAVRNAVRGVPALSYDREWYHITRDVEEVAQAMRWIIAHRRRKLTFDTETTGLKPYKGEKIVFMMFRWDDDEGQPKSIGFPWNYPDGLTPEQRAYLAPLILEAIYKSDLQGHNLAFDILFAHADIPGADLDKLCEAMDGDTWHKIYTNRQERGSLGLEVVTYDWHPELAGYEEEMVMLIEKMPELLDPAKGQGGHYANCPPELWPRVFRPYVMGDVETCHQISDKVDAALEDTERYAIPIAHPHLRGKFRHYTPPNRAWVYKHILRPGNQVLTKMMGRGLQVDMNELAIQEDTFPKQIKEARERLRNVDERVLQWCDQQAATVPGWELDLENKDQLRTVLFNVLGLPINRLTKTGQKQFTSEDLSVYSHDELFPFASCDKFTLNYLSVDHQQVRPLQEYRKVYKQYVAFVRPLRNIRTEGIDKKARTQTQHLMDDERVHSTLSLTGTRGGRLSSRDPNSQQLPKDSIVKRLYVSRFGKLGCIYQGDLSQIELRLLAAACGDPGMVRAYVKNIDLHSLTHSLVYKRKYEHCTKDYMEWLARKGKDKEAKKIDLERRIAKITNFLTGYGGGAFGLMTALAAAGIYMSEDECRTIIDGFFESYPSLKRHIQHYKDFVLANGCAVSFFGRVRYFEEVYSEDNGIKAKALRSGYNHLIQSTASDMMILCLRVIESLMRQEGLESVLVSTVHDSLVIDAKIDELPQVQEICDAVVNNIPEVLDTLFNEPTPTYDMSWMNVVPFAGDFSVGRNYLDDKKIPSSFDGDWDRLLAA